MAAVKFKVHVNKFIRLLCTLSHVCPYRMETDGWSVKIVYETTLSENICSSGEQIHTFKSCPIFQGEGINF